MPAEVPGDTAPPLFVYGTLKQGFANHEYYCRGAVSITPGWTWGRLHLWATNVPILAVPADHVLLPGTPSFLADLEASLQLETDLSSYQADPRGGWRRIQGELIRFRDFAERMKIMDAMEGFHPRAPDPFERVLLPACAGPGPTDPMVAAWAYVSPLDRQSQGEVLDVDSWEAGNV